MLEEEAVRLNGRWAGLAETPAALELHHAS
jgi:hypothetical protein